MLAALLQKYIDASSPVPPFTFWGTAYRTSLQESPAGGMSTCSINASVDLNQRIFSEEASRVSFLANQLKLS